MRIPEEQLIFLKNLIKSILADSKIYVFGSRVYDDKKGGDLDILVLGNKLLSFKEKATIRISFWKKFGEQKIDIVSFRFDDNAPFKDLALMEGVEI